MRYKGHRDSSHLGVLLIVIAGILWGTMGIFVRHMEGYGFTSLQIVCARLTVAAVCFMTVFLIREPHNIKKVLKDIHLFIATGLMSLLFFTWCYFTAIRIMDVSVAAILLYTSPIWVMLMSVLFFKEEITKKKIMALLLAFLGCMCISGLAGGGITLTGFLIGIGSGIGYGLYSIFGTVALKKHSTFALTAFSFSFAAAGAWILSGPSKMLAMYKTDAFLELILFSVVMGIITAFLPFMFYTLGLEKVEASKAAILATIEPMVATLVGVLVFHEVLSVLSVVGILSIFGAVLVLSK